MAVYKRHLMFLRHCSTSSIIFIVSCLILAFTLIRRNRIPNATIVAFTDIAINQSTDTSINEILSSKDLLSSSEIHMKLLRQKVEKLSRNIKKSRSVILNSRVHIKLNYNVHIFYYAWYGNEEFDGQYKHWNHSYLSNWKKDPSGFNEPTMDIDSNYYPALGCYSSKDPKVIEKHMRQLMDSGIGVLILSWTPPRYKDSPSNDTMELLFKYAEKYKIKIALHIEPYADRNPVNLLENLKIFFRKYKNHPALYKITKNKVEMPLVYVYHSHLTPAEAWKKLLSPKGNLSIRGSESDAIFIGLLVDIEHCYHIKKSHFDGFYTYFAANSFSYGSTWKNWQSLGKFARQNGLTFIPSVGPGYIDTRVRPWNAQITRLRRNGQYYDVAWRAAIDSGINYVSITSFNEWLEGTQIEPTIPKKVADFTYLDYEPDGSQFYLNLTKWWVDQFTKSAN